MSGSVAHNPTDGLAAPDKINLSGSGVTAIVAGQVYKVSLNVGASPNPATVALTSVLKDVAGTTFTTSNGNSVTYKSYNTNVATVSGATITAVAAGQAIIEAQFPTADGTNSVLVDMVSTQIQVTVGP